MVATVHFSPVTTTAYMNCKVPLLELVMGTEGTASIKTTRELGMSLIFLNLSEKLSVCHILLTIFTSSESKKLIPEGCIIIFIVDLPDVEGSIMYFSLTLIVLDIINHKTYLNFLNTMVIFPLLLVSEIDLIFSHLETIIFFSINNDA